MYRVNRCKEMLDVLFDLSYFYLYYREACTHASEIDLTIKR